MDEQMVSLTLGRLEKLLKSEILLNRVKKLASQPESWTALELIRLLLEEKT